MIDEINKPAFESIDGHENAVTISIRLTPDMLIWIATIMSYLGEKHNKENFDLCVENAIWWALIYTVVAIDEGKDV